MNPILKNAIKKDIKSVDKTLSMLIRPKSRLSHNVYKQVVESGKRLRPLIVLYCAKSLGLKSDDEALIIGSLIELIHTASLLHDDIIDEAELRRGRETANRVFGTKPAVLAGDYLYSLAYNMVLDFDIEIAKVISNAAYLLAEGEIKEIENAFNADLTFDDYYDIIYKKTAILLQASSISGCLIQDKQHRESFEAYGKYLGYAFQIKDDCLDYESDISILGKDVGIDLKEGKMTAPVLFAIEQFPPIKEKIVEYFQLKDDRLLNDIIFEIKQYGLKPSIDKAIDYANKAKEAVAFLEKSRYKEYLIAIADYAIERKK